MKALATLVVCIGSLAWSTQTLAAGSPPPRSQTPTGQIGAEILTQRGGNSRLTFPGRRVRGGRVENAAIYSEYLQRSYDGGSRWSWDASELPQRTASAALIARGRLGGISCAPGNTGNLPLSFITEERVIGGQGRGSEAAHPDQTCLERYLPAICPRTASFLFLAKATLQGAGNAAEKCESVCSQALTTSLFNDECEACRKQFAPLPLVSDQGVVDDPARDYQLINFDHQNNPPKDIVENGATNVFDCQNVLRIERVTTRFDWEGGDLSVGMECDNSAEVTETSLQTGGIYSNFNFSVMPCNAFYDQKHAEFLAGLQLPPAHNVVTAGEIARQANALFRCAENRADSGGPCGAPPPPFTCTPQQRQAYKAMQVLLHGGNNDFRGIEDYGISRDIVGQLTPPLYFRSLLSGPFWTKDDPTSGTQCEWLDTTYQAPYQKMDYRDFGIWDWDADARACAMIFVWEGDGGSTSLFRSSGYIGPHDAADDFIGLFRVERHQTISDSGEARPLRLENFSRDVSITFSTGNTECSKLSVAFPRP